MKLKKTKLLSLMAAFATCPVIVATTSCSSNINNESKITLDTNGYLVNNLSFKDALEVALTNPSCYKEFKDSLADEIVLKWFKNKMSDASDSGKRNQKLKLQYDEWVAKIDADYKDIVQSCRDKYGTNYQFYLQNEYLTPAGGTEESYKHNQLLAKIREFFQKEVFEYDYFSYGANYNNEKLPIILRSTYSPTENELNNPENWDRIGFYAKTKTDFAPSTKSNDYDDYLKKHLDGDYATMQSFVFDRWFATEKPFFSAASLFKYSNPKNISSNKVDDIYNIAKSKIEVPANPTEAFPFFGPKDINKEKNEGTSGFYQWYQKLLDTGFLTKYEKDNNETVESNGTISIDYSLSEDSQTLLLIAGSTMFDQYYMPYAVGHGSLFSQMFGFTNENDIHNQITQDELVVPDAGTWKEDVQKNNSFILKNFFFTSKDAISSDSTVKSALKPLPDTIHSYLDLQNLYFDNSKKKTCNFDIFNKNTKNFNDFYGVEDEQYGARYVTNGFQVNLAKKDKDGNILKDFAQPWYFELNQAGMHIQTIDGYAAVAKEKTLAEKQRMAKNILKYRLLQYKNGFKRSIFAPPNVFGPNTRLNVYFKNNYANIILEMALGIWDKNSNVTENNIFITNFADRVGVLDKNFLDEICDEYKLNDKNAFYQYLKATDQIDWYKKALTNYKTANEDIYDSKTNAVITSKHIANWDGEKYANGVTGPIGFEYDVVENNYDYSKNKLTFTTIPHDDNYKNLLVNNNDQYQRLRYSELNAMINDLKKMNFINTLKTTQIDANDAFSPQISEATKVQSNCFWYKSPFVTKLMQNEKINQWIVNKIYDDTYGNYLTNGEFNKNNTIWNELTGDALALRFLTTKVLNEKQDNYNCLVPNDNNKDNYLENILASWDVKQNINIANGYLNDNDDTVALNKVKATIAWLMTTTDTNDENYFKNFYNILRNKVTANKMAFIGYLAKTNNNYFDDVSKVETYVGQEKTIYDWKADAENIFDQHNYHGVGKHDESLIYEQQMIEKDYWTSVINKKIEQKNKQWAGFTGLLTEAEASILEGNSELKAAVFDELAKHSYNSPVSLFDNSGAKVKANQGVWFAYSGETDDNGKPITFEVTSSNKETINQTRFAKTKKVLALAKAIVDKNSKESLRAFINDLVKKYYYSKCPFKDILDNSDTTFETLDDFKYALLNVLPTEANKTDGTKIDYCCFQRLNNIQLHSNDDSSDFDYSFIDDKTGNGYKMILTQINHEDVINKTLHPRNNNAGEIDRNEFYNLVISLAMDESIQKIALTEIIRVCYKGKKLTVGDAIIYNMLNGTWIKDWTRKVHGK